jgi:hypothetical protein
MLVVIGAMGVFMHVIPTPWTQAQPAPTAPATPLARTQRAVSAPQPTSAPATGPQTLATPVATQPTRAAVTVPQAQPVTVAPAAQATAAPTGAPAQQPTTVGLVETTAVPTPPPTSQPTVAPTIDPALAAEILPAYQHYWEVRDEALATLDGSHLADVMDGIELTAAQTYISQLQTEGKAGVGTEDHSFTILSATPEDAVIEDKVVDHSMFVDIATGDPLPPDQQPKPDSEIDGTYNLHKIDGIWKVVEEG